MLDIITFITTDYTGTMIGGKLAKMTSTVQSIIT